MHEATAVIAADVQGGVGETSQVRESAQVAGDGIRFETSQPVEANAGDPVLLSGQGLPQVRMTIVAVQGGTLHLAVAARNATERQAMAAALSRSQDQAA